MTLPAAVVILTLAIAAIASCSPAPAPRPAAAAPAPTPPPRKATMICRNSQTGASAECGTPNAVMVGIRSQ
jgi:hypothetical protein